MKKIIAGLVALLGLSSPVMAKDTAQADGNVMQGLRMQALTLTPKEIGINRENFPKDVWGVLMETGYEDSAFTLVALADGTTSLYFSTGGGIIGAGEHESVRNASAQFIGWANKYASEAKPTKQYPLPKEGQVNFYLLSYNGVLTYSAPEQELGEQKDQLSNLFHAGHHVISELREIEQARHNKSFKADGLQPQP